MVDEDDSDEIEFEEFLLIMRAIKRKEQVKDGSASLYRFFKDMIEGKLNNKQDMDNDIPFMLNFSLYRRKRIIDAIIGDDDEKKKEGEVILKVRLGE